MTIHQRMAAGLFAEMLQPQTFSLCLQCLEIREARCSICPSCHGQMIQGLTVWDVLHRLRNKRQVGEDGILDQTAQ